MLNPELSDVPFVDLDVVRWLPILEPEKTGREPDGAPRNVPAAAEAAGAVA
jgi:hypothetical protein